MHPFDDSPQTSPMVIRLRANVLRFTAQHHPGLNYLGTVQRDLQIGALARRADGSYVQVNGSFIEPLDTTEVEAALSIAGARPALAGPVVARGFTAPTPTVIVRRKRRMVETSVPSGE